MLDLFAPDLPRPDNDAEAEPPAASARLDTLTAREREVFDLVVAGRSNAEIADELVVSETTVKTHVGNMLDKLGLRDRVHVVIWAYESGLIRAS
jgi:DNA-binding NarL/FixJ family response regulator